MANSIKVGIIGCGNIFPQYIKGCRAFDILDVVACADIDVGRAQSRAREFKIAKACSVAELLADSAIDIVINLTVPQAHVSVNMDILNAGKHAYVEKPLALHRSEGAQVLAFAREKNRLIGCAPDTFLGGGIQTARTVIDDGVIGRPVAAVAFMCVHGHESWHPNPEFYYKPGGGPMFDMGPYYLTALINLMGPVKRVTASTQMAFAERTITSKERYGQTITVEVPTHVAGIMDFASNAVGTIITSFDTWSHHLPLIEVYGTEGSLSVPDPNTFGGKVQVKRWDDKDWRDVKLTHSDEVGRGIGVADMAHALRTGQPHRASGELAYHVLDIMESFHDSSAQGKHIELTSTVQQPAALPKSGF